MKFLLWISLLVGAGFGLWPPAPGLAQEGTASGAEYEVQPGDTLTAIALRFGVSVEELAQANDLQNVNLLSVGQRLRIPGLEGVEGLLTTQTVNFGENLRSLSRTTQFPLPQLVRLNRLVSPAELVVGSSLVLPKRAEGEQQFRRVGLPTGGTLLELAAAQGVNPWLLSRINGYEGMSRVVSGEVLFIPADSPAGFGALPMPVDELQLSELTQGGTAVLKITTVEPLSLSGALGAYPLHFFQDSEGVYVALQGIHAMLEPGMVEVYLEGKGMDGEEFAFSQWVAIQARDFAYERINVPPEMLDEEATQAEAEQVQSFVTVFRQERMWEGAFQSPSPFPECINSRFGSRRSYNGSAFVYYHGGVDYCGGEGVEIYAPAAGEVVFSAPLTIRGIYTLIDHGWGVYSGYLHQSQSFVQPGDRVQRGQVIGLVGNTGRSTGAHLHWEMWVGGVLVNPLEWLEKPFP